MSPTQSIPLIVLAVGIVISAIANLRDGALVRVALSSDAESVFSAAGSKPHRIDDIIRPIARGNPVAVRFVGSSDASNETLENVARFYFRSCYTLYPARVYVTASDEQVVTRATDLINNGFDPSDEWCQARGLESVLTIAITPDNLRPAKLHQVPVGGL